MWGVCFCPALFSEAWLHTMAILGDRVRIGPERTKFECIGDTMSWRGHSRSIRHWVSYGSESRWVERSSDDENLEGQFKVIRGTWHNPRSNDLPSSHGHETWWMVSSLDAENIEGRFMVTMGYTRSNGYHCTTDMKLGKWCHHWLAKMLKFGSRSPLTRGHPRSNSLPLLFEHETWWMESSLDAKNVQGRFKVNMAHGSPKVK